MRVYFCLQCSKLNVANKLKGYCFPQRYEGYSIYRLYCNLSEWPTQMNPHHHLIKLRVRQRWGSRRAQNQGCKLPDGNDLLCIIVKADRSNLDDLDEDQFYFKFYKLKLILLLLNLTLLLQNWLKHILGTYKVLGWHYKMSSSRLRQKVIKNFMKKIASHNMFCSADNIMFARACGNCQLSTVKWANVLEWLLLPSIHKQSWLVPVKLQPPEY